MATHRFSVEAAAPIERVFDPWTNLDRWHERLNEFVRLAEREARTPA